MRQTNPAAGKLAITAPPYRLIRDRFTALMNPSGFPTKRLLTIVFGLVCCVLGCDPPADLSKTQTAKPPKSTASAERSPRSESTVTAAKHLLSHGRTAEAEKMLGEVLIRSPQDSSAMMLLAQIRSGNGDRAATAELLREIIRLEPNQFAARRGLAATLNELGYRFDANQQLRFLSRHEFLSYQDLRSLLVPARSHQVFADKPDIHSADQIREQGLLNIARALFSRSDTAEAIELIESSRDYTDNDPAVMAFYGQLLQDIQDDTKYAAWHENQHSDWQAYPEYWIATGQWAMRQQSFEHATRCFGESIAREPGDPLVFDLIAQSLEGLQQQDSANRFRKRAIELRQVIQTVRQLESDTNVSPGLFETIATGMVAIGRPREGISWLAIAASNFGGSPADFDSLRTQLAQLNQDSSAQKSSERVLCGIELADFQLDPKLKTETSAIQPKSRATVPDGTQTVNPEFEDVTASRGLRFQYQNGSPTITRVFQLHQALGGGLACLDYDRDGNPDLYFAQAGCDAQAGNSQQPNLLARNIDEQFAVVTESADCDDRSYSTGITSGDWNQDGLPDLIVGNIGVNSLLINQGDGTFRRQATDGLWKSGKYTTSIAIADISGDQIPDIYEAVYIDDKRMFDPIRVNADGYPDAYPGALQHTPGADRCFIGTGDGGFIPNPLPTTPAPEKRLGLGLLITDIDGRPGNEVFVANDLYPNRLLCRVPADQELEIARRHEVEFEDKAAITGLATGTRGQALACMGIAAADFDRNGRIDLHVTNFYDQWSNFYVQSDELMFQDRVLPAGLSSPTLPLTGFGCEAIDFDNDTLIDLAIGNGHIEDLRHRGIDFQMPLQFFQSDGKTFTLTPGFKDEQQNTRKRLTRGLITIDWNNDGRVDLVTNDLEQPAAILQNSTVSDNQWLQIELVGTACERDAIGAVVQVTSGNQIYTAAVATGDGYMCKNQARLHFGLGNLKDNPQSDTKMTVTIQWPDGSQQSETSINPNQILTIVQTSAADETP